MDFTQVLNINDRLYRIKRIVKETTQDSGLVDAWKSLTKSDSVFRKDGKLYFCDEIIDVEILEEIINNQN